jgi:excisionase family DNA binding protein
VTAPTLSARDLLPTLIQLETAPPILTVEKCAELLAKQPDAVRKLIRAGKIPAGQLGDRYYIVLADLIAAIRESR